MSVENPQNQQSEEIGVKPCNGESQPINGLSNGHIEMNGSSHDKSSNSKHKSSSKDKYRDKDRDRNKDRDKTKSSGSSSKDYSKSSSSSSKDKYRDKERDRDRDKERDKNRDRERDKDRDKNRDKDNKDKSSSDKDKHKSSSSSNHKSSSSKDNKDRDREKDKHRDKDKERSSHKDKEKSSRDNKERSSKDERTKESSDKDRSKDHKTSSKDKDRSSDKDKHKSDRDKDRHKSSASSSKDKHSNSSSSKSKDKDKDRDRDKDKDKSRDKDRDRKDKERDKEKRRDKEKSSKHNDSSSKLENGYLNNQTEQVMVNSCNFNGINEVYLKEEDSVTQRNHYIIEEPRNNVIKNEINVSQASSCDYSMSQFREDESAFSQKLELEESQNNYDDASQDPIGCGNNEFDQGEENDDEDAPLLKRKMDIKEEDDDEDAPLSKRKAPISYNDEDDMPLTSRKKVKQEIKIEEDSDEDTPLLPRKKVIKVESDEDAPLATRKTKAASATKKKKRGAVDKDEEFDEKPKKKIKKPANNVVKIETESPTKGGRKKKAEEEPEDVWRWWEEEKRDDSIKWNFLEHKGPMFPPEYERLPSNVRFYYDGKPMSLSDDSEEICCFYAKMLNHDYVTKKVFNDNFFKDWRKSMTQHEKDVIKDLGKCNFKEVHNYFAALSEKNKNRTKEERQALKEQNEAIIKEYGFCTIDGHKEKIGNFRLEPPGLFRGRGEHPKMGMVKRRLRAEDIIINCSKNSNIPKPPAGHRWKEVKHDNTVTWLASWIENVQGQGKYIMLNPSSKIKGEKDFQKYETARRLDKYIDKIRNTYKEEWKSKEMKIRQRAVALYFIDKLALRAGNEKDEDQADTVGCCSLRVEHVELHKEMDGKENVVVFDFLGKDSIRYYNAVPVEKRVFKNLELFKENKKEGDELFDRLNTSILNDHLRDLMEGLTAKVFRTYNASITLQRQLDLLTEEGTTIPEKMLAYNRANRAVAILCNHQRSVPKSHEKSMENLKAKIQAKRDAIDEAEAEYRELKKDARRGSVKEKINADKKLKQIERLKEQLKKLELQETDRDENKTIALGTSKLNYLDPRISVAWCKKHGVPIEKIFNKTQRDKFRWAIHMADENYRF